MPAADNKELLASMPMTCEVPAAEEPGAVAQQASNSTEPGRVPDDAKAMPALGPQELIGCTFLLDQSEQGECF